MRQGFLFLFAMLLASCAPGVQSSNRDVINFAKIEPTVQNYIDPTTDVSTYDTFTVGRLAGTEYATDRNALEESHLLSSVVSQLTQRGYRYDDTGEEADFVVYISQYQNVYQTSYVPPENYVMPRWVPGQTTTTTSNANLYYGGRRGYGSATEQTYVPGYMTTDTYTTSGYTTGNFYPAIALDFYETESGRPIYNGRTVWVSDISDMRIAFPWVANFALRDFPNATAPAPCELPSQRGLGANLLTATLNGNDYYPIVANFSEAHPVRYLSRERLQIYDAIVGVNNTSLRNILDSCQQRTIITQPNNQSNVRELQVLRGEELVQVLVELY